jgi:Ca2+-binding EF-hand superfamily protein
MSAKKAVKLEGKNNLKDKPKAGAQRVDEKAFQEKEEKKSKKEKLQGRAGTRSDPKDKEDKSPQKSGKKGGKKKKKKDELTDKKPTFKPKKKKKNFIAKLFTSTPDVILRDPRALEAVEALHLTQDHLKMLRDRFDGIDVDGSGSIDTEEFFEAMGENRSPITDRLFSLIDLDGSGTIEFEEFIRILATYCMYTKDEILRFCFETFDKDGSNAIDEKEFVELCK